MLLVAVPKGWLLAYGWAHPSASLGRAVERVLPSHAAMALWLSLAFPVRSCAGPGETLAWSKQVLASAMTAAFPVRAWWWCCCQLLVLSGGTGQVAGAGKGYFDACLCELHIW